MRAKLKTGAASPLGLRGMALPGVPGRALLRANTDKTTHTDSWTPSNRLRPPALDSWPWEKESKEGGGSPEAAPANWERWGPAPGVPGAALALPRLLTAPCELEFAEEHGLGGGAPVAEAVTISKYMSR